MIVIVIFITFTYPLSYITFLYYIHISFITYHISVLYSHILTGLLNMHTCSYSCLLQSLWQTVWHIMLQKLTDYLVVIYKWTHYQSAFHSVLSQPLYCSCCFDFLFFVFKDSFGNTSVLIVMPIKHLWIWNATKILMIKCNCVLWYSIMKFHRDVVSPLHSWNSLSI